MPYWILWIALTWMAVGLISGVVIYYITGYRRGDNMTLKEVMLTTVMGPVLPIIVGVLKFIDEFHPSKIIVIHGKRK